MKHSIKYILIFLFFFWGINYALCQGTEGKYQLAQAFEKTGDFENASRLFLELYKVSPRNKIYLNGVIRTLKGLNQYSKLLGIIEEHLEIEKSPELMTLAGELYWRAGKTDEANAAWQNAIEMDPESREIYLDVSVSQSNLFLFDKAIATLEKGKSKLGNDDTFSQKLVQLYTATGNYVKGTDEILQLFEDEKNLPLAQGRLSALLVNKDAKAYIEQELRKKTDKYNDNMNFLRLYGWFLRTVDIEKALNIYKKLDDLSGGMGTELAGFANDSKQDGQYDIALKAYDLIIQKGKNSPYFLNGLYGFARTLDYMTEVNPKLSNDEVEKIIKRYRQIIKEYPNDIAAAESRLRIAFLALDFLNDRETAKSELMAISNQFPQYPISAASMVMLGDIYITEEKFSDAAKVLNQVINGYKRLSHPDADMAKFKLAEIQYYTGNIDSAKNLFMELSENTNADISNDAINKLVLIEQNKQFTQGLKEFAKAEFKENQKNFAEAEVLYKEVTDIASGSDLAEQSYIRQAKIEFSSANFDKVRELLQELMTKEPDTIYGDNSMLLIGNSYLAQHNNEEAVKSYTQLITKYPRSIFLDEARDKIAKIRNKEL
jgi:tetratricopeptide (TPR) repeat protein